MKLSLDNKNTAARIMCIIILPFLLGCAIVPITGRKQLSLVSQYQMLSLGQDSYEQVLQQEKLSYNKEKVEMVNRVGANLGLMLPYSRLQETEADCIGLVLMARAGYDPGKAVGLWQRLKSNNQNRPPAFLLTHPAPEDRIENIKRQILFALRYYKPQPIDVSQ